MGQGTEVKTRPDPKVEIQEKGEVFFFYRPKVDKEEAHGPDDVQRMYIVLRPESVPERAVEEKQAPDSGKEGKKRKTRHGGDDDKGGAGGGDEGGLGKEEVNVEERPLLRLIVMGKKSLPDPAKHGRPFWGYVDLVTTDVQDVKDALRGAEYETKTRGKRHQSAARALGEGVYRIVKHDAPGGRGGRTHITLGMVRLILGFSVRIFIRFHVDWALMDSTLIWSGAVRVHGKKGAERCGVASERTGRAHGFNPHTPPFPTLTARLPCVRRVPSLGFHRRRRRRRPALPSPPPPFRTARAEELLVSSSEDCLRHKVVVWLDCTADGHPHIRLQAIRSAPSPSSSCLKARHCSVSLSLRRKVPPVQQIPRKILEAKQTGFHIAIATNKGLPQKAGLELDLPHRWNSTFHMLVEAIKYKAVLNSYASENGEIAPDVKEWDNAEVICDFLRAFEEATNSVSADRKPTSHQFLHMILCIRNALRDPQWKVNATMYNLSLSMDDKFEKYWEEAKLNTALVIATVLDPRKKAYYLEFFYEKYCECFEDVETNLASIAKSMKSYYELYEEQVKRSNEQSVSREANVDVGSPVLGKRRLEEEFARYKSRRVAYIQPKSELDAYLDENFVESSTETFDILAWWKSNAEKYPVLSAMARDFLAVPLSTVSSESAFSCGGRVLGDTRASLKPRALEALVCGKDWLAKLPSNQGLNSAGDASSAGAPSSEQDAQIV